MYITKTCNLVTVICYTHLISREELCNRLHFPIPSSFLECKDNGASNGAARRTPEAANFQKKKNNAGRGGSSNFGQRAIWRRRPGDRTRSLEWRENHWGLGDHNEGFFSFSFLFLISRKKIQKFLIFWIKRRKKKKKKAGELAYLGDLCVSSPKLSSYFCLKLFLI